ncbi:MAG: universal stress protein [Pseudomonadota bacterium]|nr:universal stress protein [Pseudomonadota bacterium]
MFKKILLPVDLEHPVAAPRACVDAEMIADKFGAALHVMTVMPGFSMPMVASYFPPDAKKKAKAEVEARLAAFVDKNISRKVTTSVSEGKSWREIIKAAKRRKVDLIIIPHRMHSKADEILLGSCAERVADRAPCSVLITRN